MKKIHSQKNAKLITDESFLHSLKSISLQKAYGFKKKNFLFHMEKMGIKTQTGVVQPFPLFFLENTRKPLFLILEVWRSKLSCIWNPPHAAHARRRTSQAKSSNLVEQLWAPQPTKTIKIFFHAIFNYIKSCYTYSEGLMFQPLKWGQIVHRKFFYDPMHWFLHLFICIVQ